MSGVLDWIASELREFIEADSDDGGIADVITINSVQKGDPGWLMHEEYPFIMVQTGQISPKLETVGRSGYDVLNHDYQIAIMLDATDYFNPEESGNDAEGPLEDAAIAVWLWFRKFANRRIEELGIRNVTVSSVDFLPDERGEVYAKRALLLLTVERQHQHRP